MCWHPETAGTTCPRGLDKTGSICRRHEPFLSTDYTFPRRAACTNIAILLLMAFTLSASHRTAQSVSASHPLRIPSLCPSCHKARACRSLHHASSGSPAPINLTLRETRSGLAGARTRLCLMPFRHPTRRSCAKPWRRRQLQRSASGRRLHRFLI